MNPKRKSRTTRQTEALRSALDHASANLDYDPDTGTDYGPMDKAQDFMEDIAQYFNAFETSTHDTIAGYAEAVADELNMLRANLKEFMGELSVSRAVLEVEQKANVELQRQVKALEFAASTDVRVSSI